MMTADDFDKLDELLEEFYEYVDIEDSKSIDKASTFELAAKLEEQHNENSAHLQFVMRWVKTHIRRIPKL